MSGLPETKFDIDGEAFGDGTLVAWGTYRAKVDGQFLGQQPTGKQLELPMIVVNSFRDGRMAGERIYFDLATLCDQAGFDLANVREAIAPLRASTQPVGH
jgi:predicted ester cyclase